MATEAGYSKVSVGSVLAGVLVAYGAFAILAAITGGVLSALGVETERLSDNDWRDLGIASGVGVGISLLLSYLFGGYVAGRMARRAGAMNGLLVFVVGILLAIGVGAALSTQADGDALLNNLRSIGVPTSGEEYSAIGTFAGLGALVAMLLGSIFGGISGERWHGKLLARALDPTVGPDHAPASSESTVETSAVRSSGTSGLDESAESTPALDVRNTSTTLDDDLSPEHTRTIRS